MNNERVKNGFSLIEVLLAVGVLAIGMLFVAGVFPVGIHFTTIATERTIAAVAADEAFAKIRLYAKGDPADPNDGIDLGKLEFDEVTTFDNEILSVDIDEAEFTYPSTGSNPDNKRYCWSALCRLTEECNPTDNPNPPVQVTVFVCRRTSPNLKYHDTKNDGTVDWDNDVDWPMPVKVPVDGNPGDNELEITGDSKNKTLINDGYTIVDDETGRLYRVLERHPPPDDNIILLDRDWDDSPPGDDSPDKVWVVPPPVNGGRYPCIAVYQKVIRF